MQRGKPLNECRGRVARHFEPTCRAAQYRLRDLLDTLPASVTTLYQRLRKHAPEKTGAYHLVRAQPDGTQRGGTHPMIAIDLKALRQTLQLTQAALGLRVGVHACTVSRWERGIHRPRPSHATRLQELADNTPPHADHRPPPSPRPHSKKRPKNRPTAAQKRQAPRRPEAQEPRRPEAPARRRPGNPAPVPLARGERFALYQGEFEDVLPTLTAGSFDALITDVPYCSGGLHWNTRCKLPSRKYQTHGLQIRREDFDGDQRDQLSFMQWTADALRRCKRLLRPGGVFCLFIDDRQLSALQLAVQMAGLITRGIVPWDKGQGARPQLGQFRKQCEFIVWGSKGALPTGRGVGVLPGFISEPVRPRDKHHLTGKPTAVMRFLARFVTPGGLILDPCAGSGSTGIGALLEGRRFVGIEQDAHYAQVAAKRLRETEEGREGVGAGQSGREGARG